MEFKKNFQKDTKSFVLKWIYKIKKDVSGKIIKHKVSLVAKGYSQQTKINFDEIFAPVTQLDDCSFITGALSKE